MVDLSDDNTLDLPISQLRQIFPSKLPHILSKIKDKLLNTDIDNMANTTRIPNYAKMKTHALIEPYLRLSLPLPMAQVMAQLRVNLYNLKINDKKIPLQNQTSCPWCGEGEGNSDHYLLYCPHLETTRSKFLNLFLSTPTANFIDLYNNYKNSPDFYKNIFYFFTECFKSLDSPF